MYNSLFDCNVCNCSFESALVILRDNLLKITFLSSSFLTSSSRIQTDYWWSCGTDYDSDYSGDDYSTDTDYSGDDYSTDTDYSGGDSDTDYNDYTDGEDYSENE